MANLASLHTPRSGSIKPNLGTPDSGYKIAVRFGDQVLQAGFTSIPNLVLNHYAELRISPAEMMFTIHMWQFRWTERDPYPSLTTIADKMDVSWRQAHRYAKSLEEKGFLIIKSRQEPGRGQVTSEYDFEPLIQAVVKVDKELSSESEFGQPPIHPATHPVIQPVVQPTPLTKMTGGGMTELTEAPLTGVSEEEYTVKEDPSEEDFNLSNIRKANSLKGFETQNMNNQGTTTIPIPAMMISVQRATERKDASNGDRNGQSRGEGFSSVSDTMALSTLNLPPKRTDYGEERQVIMDYVIRFAKEFSDHASLKTSTTRAFNLYKRSGVPLGAFIGRMYEAHTITRESAAAVPKPRPTAQAGAGIAARGKPAKNKMAYWFTVLEDRLGLRVTPGTKRERGEDSTVSEGSRGGEGRDTSNQKSSRTLGIQ